MKPTLLILFVVTCMLATSTAEAKRRRRRAPAVTKKAEKPAAAAVEPEAIVVGDAPDPGAKSSKGKDKVFDFTGLSIEGKLRTPQLLYFLGRARQELERASLEQRSFIPEMVRSIDEEGL